MEIVRLLASSLVAMGLLGVVAVHADDRKRTVGEYADDKLLHTKVWAALTEDKTADASEINLEVYKGVVQLNGFVDNAKEKAHAEAVAKAVSGVKGIENNLLVKQADQTAGGAIDDSTVSARVKSALIRNAETKAYDIKVETRGGVVQLSGFVDSAAQKAAADKVARSVEGVKAVQNSISIKN